MRIAILNGSPVNGNLQFDTYMNQLEQSLLTNRFQVDRFQLRDLKIQYCVGCFGCWTKKPGQCMIEDDSTIVRRGVIHSDLTIMASPVSMGMVSSELKRTMDRLIPIVLPHMEIDQGELHHRRRYPKYPKLGLILGQYGDTDQEDLEIIERSFHRVSINFKSKLYFTRLANSPVTEVLDEINRL